MENFDLHERVAQKDSDKNALADEVIKNPDLLSEVFDGLNAKTARIKYGCDKILRIVSAKAPAMLYPKIDFFIGNIAHDNDFLKWGAIDVLANLASVDTENRFEGIFDQYFAAIPGPVLVTAANVIKAAARIGAAKPHLADRIAAEMYKVEKANYRTAECRNIALGKAIETLDSLFEHISDQAAAIRFARKQLGNTRNATKKKALAFLKKHEMGGTNAKTVRMGARQRPALH